MRTASWLVMTLFLLVAWSAPALAGKKAGITMPDTITVEGKTLVLNGLGMREATFLKVDVYVAGLYLEKKSSDAAAIIASREIKRVHMKFKRDVDRDDMRDALQEGFNKNAGKNKAALKSRMSTIKKWMEKIREGGTMTLTYVPDKGIEVMVNGKRKGVLPGDDFARMLLSIWLGPKPPNKGLKMGLLGR